MKTTLGTVTLPPKNNNLPEWMQSPAQLPPRITSPEDLEAVWARIHQAQRDIPDNAFADSPIHWSEYLMMGVFTLIVLFFAIGTLACFF